MPQFQCIVVRSSRSPSFRVSQLGFTLIEVLVAILVLSFGMLGVVGLQVAAMQANKEARYQSSGVRYARELAEMMRANRTVLTNATSPYLPISYANGAGPAAYTGTCPAACAIPLVAGPPAYINHNDIANFELNDWWYRANKELSGLRVVVCADSAPYGGGVTATWTCTTPPSTAAGQSIYIKMGWTQQSTNRAADGTSTALVSRATDTGSIPLIVIPLVN